MKKKATQPAISDLVTAIVLAGGAGRRVSNQDKGLLSWQGKPLIAHVCEHLVEQVHKIIISCNRNQEHYAEYAEKIVSDSRGGFQGPLAGLEACAEFIETPYVLVASCDTPSLPRELVTELFDVMHAEDPELDIVHAQHKGNRLYLSAIIRTEILKTLPAYLDKGERSVRGWYAEHRIATVSFPESEELFTNLNTLSDIGRS